jgi:hypothetical protein
MSSAGMPVRTTHDQGSYWVADGRRRSTDHAARSYAVWEGTDASVKIRHPQPGRRRMADGSFANTKAGRTWQG